eukprot:Gb_06957 [translate_table: standard]
MRQLLVRAARAGTRTRALQSPNHGLCDKNAFLRSLHCSVGPLTAECLVKGEKLSFIHKPIPSLFQSQSIGYSIRSLSAAANVEDKSHLNAENASHDDHQLEPDHGDNLSKKGEGDDENQDRKKRKKPLFTPATSLSQLTKEDICTYITISEEDLARSIGEGLPAGLTAEYEDSQGSSLLVRASFLELRDALKSCAEKAHLSDDKAEKLRKHFIVDGPVSSGKSITLAMLVHWARAEGWFVFYVPKAKEWTHGGFYYKNPHSPLWDTPVQASTVLQKLLKSHETLLRKLPCRIFEPITLGEGAGVGMMKDAEAVAMPEGSTLFDLVQTGLSCSHAGVGVVVRLREELSLVKEVPVLFVIDQYNSWFTFSQYNEAITAHSSRPIHAREVSMVKAYRTMLHDDMMVAAYSHSTAVGKLRKHLPDTPLNARMDFPRYSLKESEVVCSYYLRQKLISAERYSEDKWKRIYYLANGNGTEIRNLARLI